jgi:hypothetical protein
MSRAMGRAMGRVLIAALVAISFTGIVYGQQANSNSTSSETDVPHLEFVFEEFVTLANPVMRSWCWTKVLGCGLIHAERSSIF